MLFDIPYQNDPHFFEAYVLAVDNQRKVCKLMTDFKQALDGVPWITDVKEPFFMDRVLVSTVLGYPVIHGVLSKVGEPASYSPNIDDGTETDTGNYNQLDRNLVHDPEKPTDILSEDKVISNRMGGIYGLLKGGTFIARASKLAQIVLSKYDDLVRIVGRNYELFTDVCADVAVSVRGRVYRWTGYSNTLSGARADTYPYQEMFGDVVLAALIRMSYYGYTPSSFGALAAANDIIRQYVITGSPNNLYQKDLHLTGEEHTIVQNTGGTVYTYVDQTKATFDVKTNDSTYTRITTAPDTVTITFNGTNTITVSSSKIECKYTEGGANNIVTITSSKIESSFNNLNFSTIDATKAELKYSAGLNTATVDATGASLRYNAGTHFVSVDSAGVHLG